MVTECLSDRILFSRPSAEPNDFVSEHLWGVKIKSPIALLMRTLLLLQVVFARKKLQKNFSEFLCSMRWTKADFEAEVFFIKACDENLESPILKIQARQSYEQAFVNVITKPYSWSAKCTLNAIAYRSGIEVTMRPRVPGVDRSAMTDENGVGSVHSRDALYTKGIYSCLL